MVEPIDEVSNRVACMKLVDNGLEVEWGVCKRATVAVYEAVRTFLLEFGVMFIFASGRSKHS